MSNIKANFQLEGTTIRIDKTAFSEQYSETLKYNNKSINTNSQTYNMRDQVYVMDKLLLFSARTPQENLVCNVESHYIGQRQNIETWISNLEHTTIFWNNLHQIG